MVGKNRRFEGRLFEAPFVAIPRTSRPSDADRARGALVTSAKPVAVDNHLLVARPLDGTVGRCADLLDVLQMPSTSDWLNNVIRCRHLTVGALASVPWRVDE